MPRVKVEDLGALRLVQFCSITRLVEGDSFRHAPIRVPPRGPGMPPRFISKPEFPYGSKSHASLDGETTLCGLAVPTDHAHLVEWDVNGAVANCARCRDKLFGDMWVEAERGEERIGELLLAKGLDMPLLGVELLDHGRKVLLDTHGLGMTTTSGAGIVFRVVAVVHVEDGADRDAIRATLEERVLAAMHKTRRASERDMEFEAVLCVRHEHDTSEGAAFESALRLGDGPGRRRCVDIKPWNIGF